MFKIESTLPVKNRDYVWTLDVKQIMKVILTKLLEQDLVADTTFYCDGDNEKMMMVAMNLWLDGDNFRRLGDGHCLEGRAINLYMHWIGAVVQSRDMFMISSYEVNGKVVPALMNGELFKGWFPIDLLSKKLILLTVNGNGHWSMVAVLNTGSVLLQALA
jgi:hypothetical protein